MKKEAQLSVEYLLIFGFAFLTILPIIIIFFTQTTYISDRIVMNQVDQITKKIVDAAESVYYVGEPSQTTLKIQMPKSIEQIIIQNREVVFKVRISNQVTDIYTVSSINLTGNLSGVAGIHFIEIKAVGDYVLISET